MTRISVALLAVVLTGLTATPASAQTPPADGSWYVATTYTVKPGMMPEFRELMMKELVPAVKKAGVKQAQTWRFSTGGADRVLRITLLDSLADRDRPSPAERGMGAAAFKVYQKKLAALIVSSASYVGRQRLDMGWNPPGGPNPKLAERYEVRIAPGRNADYLKYVQAFLEAAKKSGHRRTAGMRVFGGPAGTFFSNTYYDSWADLEKGRPPERVMSAAELSAFNALNSNGLITVVARDIMVYDAELSIAAPVTTSSR